MNENFEIGLRDGPPKFKSEGDLEVSSDMTRKHGHDIIPTRKWLKDAQ